MIGEEDVLRILDLIIDNEDVRQSIRLEVEQDRLAITRALALVQKDRPWIATTSKTKQAIRTTLNVVNECIADLREQGWIDDQEENILRKELLERLKFLQHRITEVPINDPKATFKVSGPPL